MDLMNLSAGAFRRLMLASLIIGGTLLAAGTAWARYVPYGYAPALSAGAAAPMSLKVGTKVQYVVTVTDQDTWNDGQRAMNIVDTDASALTANNTPSMQPNTRVFGHRSVDSTGKRTYDITGKAIMQTGTYLDGFTGDDLHPQNDVMNDSPVTVQQTVELVP